MSITKWCKAAAAAALLAASPAAFAGVITFEELDGSQELQGIGPTYSRQGFTFSYTPAPAEPFPTGLFTAGPSWRFNDGTIALFSNSDNALTTLTRNDERTFALLAIDLAELNGPGVAVTVVFNGTTPAGQVVTHQIALDGVTGFQRFFFPASFRHLKSVKWQQGDNITNGPHMFDNVIAVPSSFQPSE
jgi:hypothetical protein